MKRTLWFVLAVFALNGCVIEQRYYSPPPVTVRVDANPYGVQAGIDFNMEAFLATRSDPELQFQNQAGGWERIDDNGWVYLPVNQGGLTFHIIPNGHFESFEATLDGNPIGGGSSLYFGFGTGTKDNGKHLLLVTVRRRYSPSLGDPVPNDFTDTKQFRVIIFFKSSW